MLVNARVPSFGAQPILTFDGEVALGEATVVGDSVNLIGEGLL